MAVGFRASMGRERRIYEEAVALWRQLYDDPAPPVADGSMVLEMILERLPNANYSRLRAQRLRPEEITFPRSQNP